jgi:hypothetical protein
MTVQCCKCKRIRVNGHWLPATSAKPGSTSHSYCPECLFEATVEMFNERASATGLRHARDLLNGLAIAAPSQ